MKGNLFNFQGWIIIFSVYASKIEAEDTSYMNPLRRKLGVRIPKFGQDFKLKGEDTSFLNPLRRKLGLPEKKKGQDFKFKKGKNDKKSKFYLVETIASAERSNRTRRPLIGPGFMAPDNYDEEGDSDLFSGLRNKLGLVPKNEYFRSSGNEKEQKEAGKKINSLVISSLVTTKQSSTEPIKLCFPDSLTEWTKMKDKKATEEITGKQGDATCDVNIPELQQNKKIASWETLNKKLKEDSELLSLFPKGTRPPTLSVSFQDASKVFAEKYLLSEKSYNNFLAKIAFFKEHPDVNEILLEYAVTMATLARTDCSPDIPNPIEVDDVFFDKPNKTKGGYDYQLFIPEGNHDITRNEIELSGDQEESKLDYHREDSMFHAFHALFHKIWNSLRQRSYKRTFELFFYTHQQLIRRSSIERHLQGLKPVIPLDPKEFRKPLGPGYKPGWYAWPGLGGRKDNCEVQRFNATYIDFMDKTYTEVQGNMSKLPNFEQFGKFFEKYYHSKGHNIIAKACSSIYDATTGTGQGVMSYSEVSARDPIFYRWHTHIENIVQEFRDKSLPMYKLKDFELSDGIEVTSVSTLLDKDIASTKKDVKNHLITHWENANIKHKEGSTITYNRLNHLDFKYQINIKNANKYKKKVFIRLWLGLLTDENDTSTYDQNSMIEMDQFAHSLSGTANETIERLSVKSAATMKELGTTITSLMQDIEQNKATGTWCGFPHNLLVPRSLNYKPNETVLGGKTFILMAFVNDVDQDVTGGSDGIEHMMCGHKDISTRLDDRSFGFPFDRKTSFTLTEKHNFVAMARIKIMYRPERYKQSEIGVNLDEFETATSMGTTESSTAEISTTEMTTMEISTTEMSTIEMSTTEMSTAEISTTEISTTEMAQNNRNGQEQQKTRTWDEVWEMLLSMLKNQPSLVFKWLQ